MYAIKPPHSQLWQFSLLLALGFWVTSFTFLLANTLINLAPGFHLPQATHQFISPEPQPSDLTQATPTEIQILALQKQLPIAAATITDNQWDLFDHQVAWLATSAVPGHGNVILYAHNRPHLFANLNQLKPGDLIQVTLSNGQVSSYQVRDSQQIQPDDVQAILSQVNQLTLYTCAGSFDQKRHVVYATPITSNQT
jgi:LPXTG-site transpeptidase (sortase) family protein